MLMAVTFAASIDQGGAAVMLALAALVFVGAARQDYQAGYSPLAKIK